MVVCWKTTRKALSRSTRGAQTRSVITDAPAETSMAAALRTLMPAIVAAFFVAMRCWWLKLAGTVMTAPCTGACILVAAFATSRDSTAALISSGRTSVARPAFVATAGTLHLHQVNRHTRRRGQLQQGLGGEVVRRLQDCRTARMTHLQVCLHGMCHQAGRTLYPAGAVLVAHHREGPVAGRQRHLPVREPPANDLLHAVHLQVEGRKGFNSKGLVVDGRIPAD